jgi:phage shock protein PspC (stress-responsive transcriptional regulator)
MKKVVKVSIGNLAFTVEEEGFLLIKGYLDVLHDYYDNKENGDEIIEGIEERIAELFVEKCGSNTVVSAEIIKEVISILGRPETIFDEQSDTRSTGTGRQTRYVPKKLYRNADNKILGGVCSGIGAYSGLDVTLIRILFVVLFFGFSAFPFFHFGGSVMVIAYLVMWIIIPEAKTVEQRCSMYGEPMDLSNIQSSIKREAKRAGRGLKRFGRENAGTLEGIALIFAKAFSVILIFVSIAVITVMSFLFLGIEVFKGVIPLNLIDYVTLGVENTLFLKIAFMGIIFLPFVGMLWGGIQILFGIRSPRIRPGVIILLLWIASIIGFGISASKASRPYWNEAREITETPIAKHHDTIYIKFEHENPVPLKRVMMDAGYSDFSIMWMEDGANGGSIVTFPYIRVVKQSADEPSILKIRSYAHAYSYAEAVENARKDMPEYSLKDSLLTIKSRSFSKENKWNGTHQRITIFIPNDVEVVVQEPVKHDFKTVMRKEWFFNSEENRYRDDWGNWDKRWRRNFERKWENRFDD